MKKSSTNQESSNMKQNTPQNMVILGFLSVFVMTLSLIRIFALKDYEYATEIIRISLTILMSLCYLIISKLSKEGRLLLFIGGSIQLVQIICEVESIKINFGSRSSGAYGAFFLGLYFKLGSLLYLKWQFEFLIKCFTMIYYALRVCSDETEIMEFCLQASTFLIVLFLLQYFQKSQLRIAEVETARQESQRNVMKEFVKQRIPAAIVILGLKENGEMSVEFTNSASDELLRTSDSIATIEALDSFVFKRANDEDQDSSIPNSYKSKKLKIGLGAVLKESLKSLDYNQYSATYRITRAKERDSLLINNKFVPKKKIKKARSPEDLCSLRENVALEQEPFGDPKASSQKQLSGLNIEISNLNQKISSLNNNLLNPSKQYGKRFFSVKTSRVPWEGRIAVLLILDEYTDNIIKLDKKAVRKNSEEKGSILAAVSHKLYTALNGIMSSLDSIKTLTKKTDQSLTKHIKFCSKSVHLLYYSIRNLVDLSKNEKTPFDFDLTSYQLGSIMNDVLNLTRFLAKIKGIQLEVNYEENKDINVYCDAEGLKRVLINLLDNAIKYTNPGGKIIISVVLKGGSSENEGNSGLNPLPEEGCEQFAQFIIKDNGCGIPESRHQDIFKFTYKDSAESPLSDGVCTGLPLSQKLLKSMLKREHHSLGLLKLSSYPYNPGTQISFQLPIEKPSVNDPRVSSTHIISLPRSTVCKSSNISSCRISADLAIEKNNKNRSPNQIRVLIVDDDKCNQVVLRNYLLKFGVELIETADNGQEAVDKVVKASALDTSFHIILMDLNMPIKNGYQASREINLLQKEGKIPVTTIVAITANIASNDWPACREVGMKAFLTKPVNKKLFKETLETLLGEKIFNS